MKNVILATVALALSAVPALAGDNVSIPKGAQFIKCEFHGDVQSDILPNTVYVIRTTSGAVQVIDPMGIYLEKAPMPVVVDADNDRRSTWKWSFDNLGGGQSGDDFATEIDFKLTLVKATRSALVTIRPSGYRDEQESGTCSDWQTKR